jgi:pyruvate/2-oxoglutarate/acetoin dehydrogenase E1 component
LLRDIAGVMPSDMSDYLTAPVTRVASLDIPVQLSPPMENLSRPNVERIATGARSLLKPV